MKIRNLGKRKVYMNWSTMFGNFENEIIEKGVISESELAELMFESLLQKNLTGKDKEWNKKIYIAGFEQRKNGQGFELNNGTEMEQLSVLFHEEKNHISLTEIDLLSVDQGFDVITYYDKLHMTEVKSSLRQKKISSEEIIKKIFVSIKSQLCDNKKIANQFLDTIKIINKSDIPEVDIEELKELMTEILDSQSEGTNILDFHEKKRIQVKSFITCTADEEKIIDIFKTDNFEKKLKEYYEKNTKKNHCVFCNKQDCNTEQNIEGLTVKYKIYTYRLNNKFNMKIYLEELIGMIKNA